MAIEPRDSRGCADVEDASLVDAVAAAGDQARVLTRRGALRNYIDSKGPVDFDLMIIGGGSGGLPPPSKTMAPAIGHGQRRHSRRHLRQSRLRTQPEP